MKTLKPEYTDLENRIKELEEQLTELQRSNFTNSNLAPPKKWYQELCKKNNICFALLKVVVDKKNTPVDLIIVDANKAFERIIALNLEDITGKKITDLLPNIRNDKTDWIGIFGKVALSIEGQQFENTSEFLGKYCQISAYQIEQNYCGVTFLEISEQKQEDNPVNENEQKFLELFQKTPIMMGLKSTGEAKYIEVNNEFIEQTGYSREEILGKTPLEIGFYEEKDRIKLLEYVKTGSKVKNIEVKICRKDGSTFPCLITRESIDILGETYILLLAQDITERKNKEKLIDRNQQIFALFVEHSPAAIAMLDNDLKYIVASKRYLSDFRVKKENIVGYSHYEIFPEIPDRWREILKKCLSGQIDKSDEDHLIREDGSVDWLKWAVHPWYEIDGKIGGIILFSEVITEQIQARELLLESEARLSKAQQISKIGDFTWDTGSGKVTWSDGMFMLLGYDKSENIDYQKVNTEIHHPDDLNRVTRWLEECITSGKDELTPNEYRIIRKDGKILNVRTVGVINREQGKAPRIFATVQDITLQVSIETELREAKEKAENSEAFINTVIDNQFDTFFLFNPTTKKAIRWNKHFNEISGYSDEEITDMNAPDDYYDANDLEVVNQKIDGILQKGRGSVELNLITKSGKRIPFEYTVSLIPGNNEPLFLSIGRNISERKHAEQLLRLSEEKFASAFNYSPMGLAISSIPDGKFYDVNNSFCEIFGYNKEEIIDRTSAELNMWPPGERQKMIDMQIQKGGITNIEVVAITKSGGSVNLSFSSNPIQVQNKKFIISTLMDISERKKTENALRESEARLSKAQQISKIGDFTWDIESGEVIWSNGMFDLLGYDHSEIIDYHKVHTKIHHPDDLDRLTLWFEECISSNSNELIPHEYRIIRKDGKIRTVRAVGEITRKKGKVVKIFATVQDITEEKLVEKEKQLTEEKYKKLFDYVPDGILIADHESYYLDANESMCRMLGYSRAQIIGMHARDIVVPTEVKHVKPALDQILSEHEYQREWQFRRKDGSTFFADVIVTTMPDGNLIAMIRDITEQKKVNDHRLKRWLQLQTPLKEGID